jgi:hypothetical protein
MGREVKGFARHGLGPLPPQESLCRSHTQYDVQGSYRIPKGLSVLAYGPNLSNQPFGFYQASSIYPILREFYHPTVSVGLRWTSAGEWEVRETLRSYLAEIQQRS